MGFILGYFWKIEFKNIDSSLGNHDSATKKPMYNSTRQIGFLPITKLIISDILFYEIKQFGQRSRILIGFFCRKYRWPQLL